MGTEKKGCIIFKGHSQYGAFDFFIKEIREGFEKLGYSCYVVDVYGPGSDINKIINRLRYLCERKNIKFALGFNAIRLDYTNNNVTHIIFDYFQNKMPFIGFMVDNPFYHYSSLAELAGNVAYSFVCNEHVDIAQSIDKSVAFIPHGACISDNVKNGVNVNKDIEVVFGGSISRMRSEIYKDITQRTDVQQRRVFDGILEYMEQNPCKSYYETVKYVYGQLNLELGENWFRQLSSNLPFADLIIRTEKRIKVLKAIADSGVKITCFGEISPLSGLEGHKFIELRPPVNFSEMMDITARSKITLNILPNFINGAHERIFSAMANKSLCLTDGNTFICQQFTDGDDILLYDYDNLDKIGERIKQVLKDQELYNNIVEKAEKKVMANFTWDNAAEAVVKLAESVELNH